MEKLWDYLRQNKLCALVWDTYKDILQGYSILITSYSAVCQDAIESDPTLFARIT
jgi:hypothetical protein